MIKWYDLDSEFTSGKYEGLTLKEVFEKDPAYIDFNLKETEDFVIDEFVLEELSDLNPKFKFSPEALEKREAKEFQFDQEATEDFEQESYYMTQEELDDDELGADEYDEFGLEDDEYGDYGGSSDYGSGGGDDDY